MVIQQYRNIKFQKKNLILLQKIKIILQEYQDIKVTLRQLYYQLVIRIIISNLKKEYDKISRIIKLARYGGLIDWEAIEDRVRVPNVPNTFRDIKHLLEVAKENYQLDRWIGQDYYIELWTEKDALTSVIKPITSKYQVVLSVVRGFDSTSDMHESAQRFQEQEQEGKINILLYLGDYDPSGLYMDGDIKSRLEEFGVNVQVIRIGLTQEQIKQYNLPENPVKESDPRAKWYLEKFGKHSWEVDALRPDVLQELIESSILQYLDINKFQQVQKKEQEDIQKLEKSK